MQSPLMLENKNLLLPLFPQHVRLQTTVPLNSGHTEINPHTLEHSHNVDNYLHYENILVYEDWFYYD